MLVVREQLNEIEDVWNVFAMRGRGELVGSGEAALGSQRTFTGSMADGGFRRHHGI